MSSTWAGDDSLRRRIEEVGDVGHSNRPLSLITFAIVARIEADHGPHAAVFLACDNQLAALLHSRRP